MTSNNGFGSQLVPYDFDGNGTTDILFERDVPGGGKEYLIWTLDGASILDQAVIGGNAPGWSLSSAIADYDGNGTTDLLFSRPEGNVIEYGVWSIDGTQVTGQAVIGTTVPTWDAVEPAFGDFDGNGSADLFFERFTLDSEGNQIHEYGIWLSNGTEAPVQAVIGINTDTPDWFVVESADFNADATSDLIFGLELNDANGNFAGYEYAVWTLNGVQITGQAVIGSSGADWGLYTFASDFNGDGTTDLVFEREVSGGTEYAVWTINGTQATSQAVIDIATTGWSESYVIDANGDGASDLLFEREIFDTNNNLTGREYAVWTLDGTQATSQAVIGLAGAEWDFIDFTKDAGDYNDFNGDGKTDLLFSQELFDNNGSIVGYEFAVWLLDGTNVIAQKSIGTSGEGWIFTGSADTNADGIADLGFINETTAQYAVWTLGADGSVTDQAVLGAYDDVNNLAGWAPVTNFYYIEPA